MSEEIDIRAASLSGGLTWAAAVFVLGVGSKFIPSWQFAIDFLSGLYIGYSSTLVGSLIGAIWGFVDVFVALYIFLKLYEFFRNEDLREILGQDS
ncbi:MAG: hypothetical protein ABEJ03_01995 [Candidatus Nanohaloarchaea archaeon]